MCVCAYRGRYFHSVLVQICLCLVEVYNNRISTLANPRRRCCYSIRPLLLVHPFVLALKLHEGGQLALQQLEVFAQLPEQLLARLPVVRMARLSQLHATKKSLLVLPPCHICRICREALSGTECKDTYKLASPACLILRHCNQPVGQNTW